MANLISPSGGSEFWFLWTVVSGTGVPSAIDGLLPIENTGTIKCHLIENGTEQ